MQNDSMSIMYVYLYMAFPLNMAATLKLTALALLRIITILYCRRPPLILLCIFRLIVSCDYLPLPVLCILYVSTLTFDVRAR